MIDPSWKDLEEEREENDLPNDHIKNVMARIGQTPDGRLLAEWLIKTRVYAVINPREPDSALREFNAERRVAVRLVRLLETPLAPTKRRRHDTPER